MGARILAFLFRIVPKIGPFKALGFKVTPPQGETLFMRSFNDTLDRYRSDVTQVRAGNLRLPDTNFDTGKPTRQGEYDMADRAYAKLLATYVDKQVQPSPEVRANILAFSRDPSQINDPKARQEYDALKQQNVVTAGQ